MLLAWLCAAAMGALAVYMEDAMYWTVRLTFAPVDLSKIQPEEGMKMLKMVSCFVVFYLRVCMRISRVALFSHGKTMLRSHEHATHIKRYFLLVCSQKIPKR